MANSIKVEIGYKIPLSWLLLFSGLFAIAIVSFIIVGLIAPDLPIYRNDPALTEFRHITLMSLIVAIPVLLIGVGAVYLFILDKFGCREIEIKKNEFSVSFPFYLPRRAISLDYDVIKSIEIKTKDLPVLYWSSDQFLTLECTLLDGANVCIIDYASKEELTKLAQFLSTKIKNSNR